ncbi:MAG: type II secretion system protein [Actinomycetota bacterium]
MEGAALGSPPLLNPFLEIEHMHAWRHRTDQERGFTLIELMVVILIVGILIAIALPTYLGTRKRAQDRAAQTNLRTGLAAAMIYWSENARYTGFDAAVGLATEPSLDWADSGDPSEDQVAIQLAQAGDLLLVTHSASGTYFCLRQLASSPAFIKGRGQAFADVDTLAECTGGW